MPSDTPTARPQPSGEFDLDEWIAALQHRAQVDPKSSTPVNDRALASLIGAADCRAHVKALRAEMRDEIDEVKAAIADSKRESREEMRDVRRLVETLPEKFAEAAFADRAQERAQRTEGERVRLEVCKSFVDRLLGSKIFLTFAGASMLTVVLGVFMAATSFDLSIADWFNLRADRTMEAGTQSPSGLASRPTQ